MFMKMIRIIMQTFDIPGCTLKKQHNKNLLSIVQKAFYTFLAHYLGGFTKTEFEYLENILQES